MFATGVTAERFGSATTTSRSRHRFIGPPVPPGATWPHATRPLVPLLGLRSPPRPPPSTRQARDQARHSPPLAEDRASRAISSNFAHHWLETCPSVLTPHNNGRVRVGTMAHFREKHHRFHRLADARHMKSARRRALGADYTRVGGRLGGRRIAASRARVPVGGGAGAPGGVRTTGAIRRAFGGGGLPMHWAGSPSLRNMMNGMEAFGLGVDPLKVSRGSTPTLAVTTCCFLRARAPYTRRGAPSIYAGFIGGRPPPRCKRRARHLLRANKKRRAHHPPRPPPRSPPLGGHAPTFKGPGPVCATLLYGTRPEKNQERSRGPYAQMQRTRHDEPVSRPPQLRVRDNWYTVFLLNFNPLLTIGEGGG